MDLVDCCVFTFDEIRTDSSQRVCRDDLLLHPESTFILTVGTNGAKTNFHKSVSDIFTGALTLTLMYRLSVLTLEHESSPVKSRGF